MYEIGSDNGRRKYADFKANHAELARLADAD
jgi:hypothetical protein